MSLEYGLDNKSSLIFIGNVAKGLTNLKCPYCAGQLVSITNSAQANLYRDLKEF